MSERSGTGFAPAFLGNSIAEKYSTSNGIHVSGKGIVLCNLKKSNSM